MIANTKKYIENEEVSITFLNDLDSRGILLYVHNSYNYRLMIDFY